VCGGGGGWGGGGATMVEKKKPLGIGGGEPPRGEGMDEKKG
jgi:hypothetical protein